MASPDGLVAALARCQLAFPAIVKSHTNPAFKGSQYADVADVLAAVRPVLAAEGIVFTQRTSVEDDGTVLLITQVMADDDDIQSLFPLAVQGLTAQQVGSLLTYHRRYQACALLGVHPVGDDDDGNLAATAQNTQGHPRDAATATSPPANDPPDDWKTRPLATMTFSELRGVAAILDHPFSGGSKSELIRQLEPLVRAMSGDEPFDLPEGTVIGHGTLELNEPNEKPFEPKVAKPRETLKTMKPDVRESIRNGPE